MGRAKKYKSCTHFTMTIEQELLQQFRTLSRKEGNAMSDIIQVMMEKYIHDHDKGNPAFTLDQFNDKEFKVCPSFFENRKEWAKYIKNSNDREMDEIVVKSDLVKSMINTERYGRRTGSNLVL